VPLGLVLAVIAAAVGFFALALPPMRVERRRGALQFHLAELSSCRAWVRHFADGDHRNRRIAIE
jgi:hypothetical protein